jgi:hypothetical protein
MVEAAGRYQVESEIRGNGGRELEGVSEPLVSIYFIVNALHTVTAAM